MKKIYLSILFLLSFGLIYSQAKPSIHSYTANTIKGSPISLSKYAGKKLLIVNTASFCGYTYEYAALQLLYQNYHQYDFEILGFPCNDFGGQEPFSDSVINAFSFSAYGITFPMMSKVKIAAGDTAPVYRWLQQANLNGKQNISVAWNFEKFLINESGNLVGHYLSAFNPADTAFTNWILSPSSLTGVQELQAKHNKPISILSSNPCRGNIQVLFNQLTNDICKLSLFSMDSKFVKELYNGPVSMGDIHNYTISSINSGVYFLNTQINNREFWTKIIIDQ